MNYTNKSIYTTVLGIFAVIAMFAAFLPANASAAVPTCTFSTDPVSVANGGSTTLTWDTTDADSVYINNGVGYVNADDPLTLYGFYSDVTYTLTAINGDGATSCEIHIDVEDSNDGNTLAPTCNIAATPQSVSYNGSVILNWTSSAGAVYASIDNGVGVVQKNGSKVVEHITDTTTFKLLVSNTHGSNTCSVTVYKDTAPGGPAPTCTIDIDPERLDYAGNAMLTWNAYHANSASIDNGIGAVTLTGGKLISPSNSTTYVMTVQDEHNRIGYCSKTVTVQGGNYYVNTGGYYGGIASQSVQPVNAYQYSNVVSLSNLPYTGVSEVLYVLAMLLAAVGSVTVLYKFGRELV